MAIAGMKLMVPSSVGGSGVSVSATGKVSFTTASTINVNGCFTSTYDNYLIVWRAIGNTGFNVLARLRASGSDASGSDYTREGFEAVSTTVGAARQTSQSSAILGNCRSSRNNGIHLYLYGPALAQPTAMRTATIDPGNTNVSIYDLVATHSLSTAYDGITFFPNTTATITGSLTIYGLSQ